MRTAVGTGPAGQRILVCDDSRAVVNLLKRTLESDGNSVVGVYDGSAVIQCLDKAFVQSGRLPFDQVIVDLGMPVTDGYEVVKWIRRHDPSRSVNILLMVDDNFACDLYEQAEHRPDAFLLKGQLQLA